jgi:hypothetical protein
VKLAIPQRKAVDIAAASVRGSERAGDARGLHRALASFAQTRHGRGPQGKPSRKI